jgi:hypothetical protein
LALGQYRSSNSEKNRFSIQINSTAYNKWFSCYDREYMPVCISLVISRPVNE